MLRVPESLSPEALSDWLEASIMVAPEPPTRISETEILEALETGGVPDPEALLSNIRGQIRSRGRVLSRRYPIRLEGSGFDRKGTWPTYLPYSFLLFVSLNQWYADLTFQRGAATTVGEMFEEFTGLALRRYLNASILRIGSPRRPPVPAGFPDAVGYAAAELGEECGYGEMEIHQSGDDGLDLLAWLPFPDRRASQLIALAQCAIGTNWAEKRSDLDVKLWQRHIRWDVDPVRVFSIPFEHEPGNSWRETSVRAGIVLDRVRLVSLVGKQAIPTPLEEQLTAWSALRFTQVSELLE